jgi:hypothetical protein
MKDNITRNRRRTTESIFSHGTSLITMCYQDLPKDVQEEIRQTLGIASHDVALNLIKITKRFTGKVKNEMIQKHLFLDTLVNMASEAFTDKHVTQALSMIDFPASNSNKCAFDSKVCRDICDQVRNGIPSKSPKGEKEPESKQQSFDYIKNPSIEETAQIKRDLQEIFTSFKHSTSLLNSRMDSLEEYKRNRETEIAKEQATIKEIESTSANFQALSEKLETLSQKIDLLETQKKTQSNGHIKQTKQ